MQLGVGFHKQALSRWEAAAGRDEAGSHFQLSSLNHVSGPMKPEGVCRGKEKA